MSEDYRFSITIPGDMPADEREALVLALRSHAKVQELESRDAATLGLTLVAIMKDVAMRKACFRATLHLLVRGEA